MTMVITDQVPKCDAKGNTSYKLVIENFQTLTDVHTTLSPFDVQTAYSAIRKNLNSLVQEAFEAGFVHAQGGK